MRKKGFGHDATEESIKDYGGLSAELKLKWLEEVNRFLYNSMSENKRKIAEKFRAGEI